MAKVIAFRTRGSGDDDEALPRKESAQIIIFPGVRRNRPATVVTLKRRPKKPRDTLKLPD